MDDRILQETKDGTVLTVHIQPNASRTECAGTHGDAVKIRVAAPPVDGAANEALIRFVAKILKIPSSTVRIAAGSGGRRKRILIQGVTPQLIRSGFRLPSHT